MEERQQRLRDYLIFHKDEWKTRKEILLDLIDVYGLDNDDLYRSTSARNLTEDIRLLNNSDEFDFVIVSNSKKGVKVANQKECEEFLLREKRTVLRRLKRVWKKYDKAYKNNQARVSNDYRHLEVISGYIDEE